MSILRSILNEGSYPGEYTPKNQIMQALSEGSFEMADLKNEPKISVDESEENYKVEFTFPGLQRENLLVTINEKGNLAILLANGSKKLFSEVRKVQTKPTRKVFIKEIPLPEYVDPSFTSATCHAGTLTIFFIKSKGPVRKRPTTIVVY